MRRICAAVFCNWNLLFHIFTVLSLVSVQTVVSKNMDSKLSASLSNFASRFCYELDKNKSVVSSPLSAEVLLALLTLGTTDPSHTELLTSLGFEDDKAIRLAFSAVSSKIRDVKGITLDIANKIYIKEGDYELVPQLKEDAVKVFDAAFEKINFEDNVVAVDSINKWVESKTNNRIKDLLKPDNVGSETRLVLVNALYFKGTWKKQFNEQFTTEQPFNVDANKTINVAMMYKEDNFKYGESSELNAQILELDYLGEEASMVIVLPNEIDGLNPLLKRLADGYDLTAELGKLRSIKVQVTIPKFKIETEIDLNALLPKLGIKSIFSSEKSGLTRILENKEQLVVSKAVQKAFIEVNEQGAEAAAATAFAPMKLCDSGPRPLIFNADHPFLVIIRAKKIHVFWATFIRSNLNGHAYVQKIKSKHGRKLTSSEHTLAIYDGFDISGSSSRNCYINNISVLLQLMIYHCFFN